MALKTNININFDSLGWAFSADPSNFKDPSFFRIADRFFDISDKYGFKYTIFVIGRDLENPEIRERVKEWSNRGHEIGNHSYGHRQNLGSLRYDELEAEIMKSHELIFKACGREPRGFIAPAWATSGKLVEILIKHNYLYDTSVFPSYFMALVLLKLRWNFRNDKRKITVFRRKDKAANLFAPTEPYFLNEKSLFKRGSKGILMLPLPVTPLSRIPCWHTMSFILPRVIFKHVLGACLTRDYFYYLVHPADLLDTRDIPSEYSGIRNLERMGIPLEEKMEKMQSSIETIVKNSRKIVTLEEIAKSIISERGPEP